MREYDLYFEEMKKNMKEKMDFIIEELETLDYVQVIDIGCADGTMLNILKSMFPYIDFIGYDKNEKIIQHNIKNDIAGIKYITKLNYKDLKRKETFVILSSVMHEIYSFSSKGEIIDLFYIISNARGFAIRDMLFSETKKGKYYLKDIIEDFSQEKKEMFDSFIFHTPNETQYITEFLMKSRFKVNYQEEIKENYFATNWEEIDKFFSKIFTKIYFKDYKNKFLSKEIEYLCALTNTTHRKVIYKRLN